MLCKRLDMVPVECVARGYLTGSGLKDYQKTGEVCGITLPDGLVESSRLPEPIFTPATKAAIGEHDENVSEAAVAATVGAELTAELKRLTMEIFGRASELALGRGIILADTKFEFGRDAGGVLTLGDEVLTPDSSRSGRPTTTPPAARSRRTTSSTSATGCAAPAGTPTAPRPSCLPTSSSGPAPSTSRRTSGSPARRSTTTSRRADHGPRRRRRHAQAEILDPQGQAVMGALPSLGFAGVRGVRVGKHFEIELDGDADDSTLAEVHAMAEKLLSNPVIEDFTVRAE
jgi:phosphoribosylformylglycinamidine synthase PurS subunit